MTQRVGYLCILLTQVNNKNSGYNLLFLLLLLLHVCNASLALTLTCGMINRWRWQISSLNDLLKLLYCICMVRSWGQSKQDLSSMLSLVELGLVALPCEGLEIQCLCQISCWIHILIYPLGVEVVPMNLKLIIHLLQGEIWVQVVGWDRDKNLCRHLSLGSAFSKWGWTGLSNDM